MLNVEGASDEWRGANVSDEWGLSAEGSGPPGKRTSQLAQALSLSSLAKPSRHSLGEAEFFVTPD